MVDGTAASASARETAPQASLDHLGGDELRARVERSYQDGERTIAEWQAFVEGRERALQAMRASRRAQGRPVASLAPLAS